MHGIYVFWGIWGILCILQGYLKTDSKEKLLKIVVKYVGMYKTGRQMFF